jgi:hypothetical protein
MAIDGLGGVGVKKPTPPFFALRGRLGYVVYIPLSGVEGVAFVVCRTREMA